MRYIILFVVLICNSTYEIVRAINEEAGARDAEPNHRNHIFVLQEGEYTVINKQPVLILRVNCVSKIRPDNKYNHRARLSPEIFDAELDLAKREIKNAPAEQKSVIYEGLEYLVAEGGLTAKRRSGIAHPHNSARDGKNHYSVLYGLEFLIELRKRRKHTHKRADVEGKLIYGNAAIAVG